MLTRVGWAENREKVFTNIIKRCLPLIYKKAEGAETTEESASPEVTAEAAPKKTAAKKKKDDTAAEGTADQNEAPAEA